MGAAMLAGLAEGVWSSQDEVAALWAAERTFTPRASAGSAAEPHARWLRAVERARGWATEADADVAADEG
jgi:glycerol kinase